MPCWHVGPCGVGCDGYTANPQPMPRTTQPIIFMPPASPLMPVEIEGILQTLQRDNALLRIQKEQQYQELNEKLTRADRAADEVQKKLDTAILQISELRETNTRLNRRCQDAESAASVKVEEIHKQGGSFGRALAAWSAGDQRRKAEEATAKLEESNRLVDELKKRLCAGICGKDFPGFAAGEHMPTCPFRTPCQRAHTPHRGDALYADGIRSVQCGNCEVQIPLIPPTDEKRNHEVPPMPSLDGPEPTLSPEDQAALEAIKCKRCGLHGLRCVFCTPASSSTCGH